MLGSEADASSISCRVRQPVASPPPSPDRLSWATHIFEARRLLRSQSAVENSAIGLIALEAESVGLPPFREAIEYPNPDFAALARACGAQGFTAKKPDELKGAIEQALVAKGPAIIDAVVAADELPNLPHLEVETIQKVAVAKVKEAVLAVTGG